MRYAGWSPVPPREATIRNRFLPDPPGTPRRMAGRIILVQEANFVVMDAAGRARRFVLSSQAPVGGDELGDLAARRETVIVAYRDGHGMGAATATQLIRAAR